MSELHIHLLGTFQVLSAGEPVTGFRSNKVRALLAYLALSGGRPCHRDGLASLLWGEFVDRAARANLRQSLSNLRQLLPSDTLTVTPQMITFHSEATAVWVDVLTFQHLVADSRHHQHPGMTVCPECLARLVKAAALYRSELLAGFHLPDAPAFEEWRVPPQEALHQMALWVLATLVESYGELGQPEEQISYLHRQIGLEPWHESAHRQLMELLAQQGQRSRALAQYETCRRILAEELGIDPSAEMMALYELIKADRLPPKTVVETTAVSGHNLPSSTTTFIGREGHIAELCRLLTHKDTRLVTIVGLAGIGKTRLAQTTASRLLAAFPQGVWYVPLAGLKAEAAEMEGRLAATVLSQLHVDIPPNQEPFETLGDFLHHQEILLVLDNMEHLLPAATAVVVELLNRAPHLTILATSQARLDCQAETLVMLDGLAIPSFGGNDVTAVESGQLFMERARRHYPDFVIADDDGAQLAVLCRLLEGLPLALELAASLVAHYSLAEIVSAIEQNLSILATTMQDLSPRHRTLRAAFHYTWQLLSAAEQRVLAQLSLFSGEFTREAALAITDASLTDLITLVNHSMLQPVSAGHYVLHSLICQFATEMLAGKPEALALAQARYGRYYLTFLQGQMTFFNTRQETQAWLAISREIDNIRPAWQRLVARSDWEGMATAMAGLMHFYHEMGWHKEGLRLVEETLRQLPAADHEQVPAQLQCWQAIFWLHHGRYPQAETQLCQLVSIFQENENAPYLVLALLTLGRLAVRIGDFEAAIGWLTQALAGYEAMADKRGMSQTRNQLGQYYERMGQLEEAQRQYTYCLAQNREWGQGRETAVTLRNLGRLAQRQGQYAQAQTLLAESVAIYQEMGNAFAVITGLSTLALTKMEVEAYAEAGSLLMQAEQIQEELGYCPQLITVLDNLELVAHLHERTAAAEVHLQERMPTLEMEGEGARQALMSIHLGQSYLGLQQHEQAQACFLRALAQAQTLSWPTLALEAVTGLAAVKMRAGNLAEARQLLQLPLSHPAAEEHTRQEAQAMAAEIGRQMEGTEAKTGLGPGHSFTLEEATIQLLKA